MCIVSVSPEDDRKPEKNHSHKRINEQVFEFSNLHFQKEDTNINHSLLSFTSSSTNDGVRAVMVSVLGKGVGVQNLNKTVCIFIALISFGKV